MPEEYGEHDLAVPGDKDEASGANVPESFRHFTDSLDPLIPPISGAGDGKLVIVQSGAPAYKALSGDATLNAAGALTVADGAVTSRKLAPTCGILELDETRDLETSYREALSTQLVITPEVASILKVTGIFRFGTVGIGESENNASSCYGSMRVDAGEEETRKAELVIPAKVEEFRATVSQSWLIPLTAEQHYVTLRWRATSTEVPKFVFKDGTCMMYELIAAAE